MTKVAFFIASDTLVYLFKPILERMFDTSDVYILFPKYSDEGARKAYSELFSNRLNNIKDDYAIINDNLDYLVCGNDWSPEIKLLMWVAKKKKVVCVAVQESVVDISNSSQRYLFADVVFAQGDISKKLLKRENVIVTGNPRYEVVAFDATPGDYVLINCNFTYGIFEDVRKQWINDVTSALIDAGLSFKISKHPRDFSSLGHLDKYVIPSGAGVIHEQVNRSRFVITRFSSLIHESILMGRPVIYYNPHGENMGYDFSPDNIVLHLVTDYDKLINSISYLADMSFSQSAYKSYIEPHIERSFVTEKPSYVISEYLTTTNSIAEIGGKKISLFFELYSLVKFLVFRWVKKIAK